jgi:hypothetical protein
LYFDAGGTNSKDKVHAMSVTLSLYATSVFIGAAILLSWPVTVLRNDLIQVKWTGPRSNDVAMAMTLLVWGSLSLLVTMLFVQVYLNDLWNQLTLGALLLVAAAVVAAISIQLWHPNSLEVRARRAKRSGQLQELLQIYLQAGEYDKLQLELQAALPQWPVGEALVKSVGELLQLQRGAFIAKEAGVSKAITDGIAADAQCLTHVLLSSANRIAGVSAQYNTDTSTNDSAHHPLGLQYALAVVKHAANKQVHYPSFLPPNLRQHLQYQAEQCKEILVVARDAREELALATIGKGTRTDYDEATERLTKTAKLAQDSW